MNLGLTQNDVLDPNLLNKRFEELDVRFNKLPLGGSQDIEDKIRENLHSWGDFYWSHPTGLFDPKEGEPTWVVRSWCRNEQAGCTEGTKWNQVYRATAALLDKAETATAGQPEFKPEEPSGEVIKKEEIDITAMKPLWWLLVPVVFLLGGALVIKPRRLREAGRGGPLPEPVPVEGVDDAGDAGDVEDCGCDDGGDDALEGFPLEHLDRGAHAISNLEEQINLLKKDVKKQSCETTFSDLQWAETYRAIANTHLRAVTDDPESSEEERGHAEKEAHRLEKAENAYKKLEDSFRNACLR